MGNSLNSFICSKRYFIFTFSETVWRNTLIHSKKKIIIIKKLKKTHKKHNLYSPFSLQFKEKHVSINGGWCEKESSPSSSSHVFDVHFASALADFLQGEKVASFGDGPGEYKKYMDNSRKVALYDAYDGAPYCEKTTNGIVKFLDLTAPQYGLPVYDWVVSVEVAEHIPAKYESVYLDNIFRHAQQGIILSWAVPGQGGLSHVNLKSLEDVINLMLDNGYKLDPYAGKVLRKAASVSWLKQNINVYRRISKTALSPDNA